MDVLSGEAITGSESLDGREDRGLQALATLRVGLLLS
jgi:hypothetical protein